MIAQDISQWLAMGGYGLYVWGSFGVTALCIAIEVIWVKQARVQALTQIVNEMTASETQGKDWQS